MKNRIQMLLPLAVLLTGGCRTTGDYLWVDALPVEAPRTSAEEYVIASGDLLNIRVWNQDAVSGRARVRSDGKISLPFLNDVEAAGSQPTALARRIQTRLKDFIVNPVVTVSLEETRPVQVSVLGEVSRPGMYTMEQNAGVLNALAAAGGMTPYASKDRIFVLRRGLGNGRGQAHAHPFHLRRALTGAGTRCGLSPEGRRRGRRGVTPDHSALE